MAVAPERLAEFDAICRHERAPYAVIGEATQALHLSLDDDHFGDRPIDLPLGKTPKMLRAAVSLQAAGYALNRAGITLVAAVNRMLHLPAVAEKTFLVTIDDRSVTGMLAQDQMVGPWQVPLSLVITAFDRVEDVRATVPPQLQPARDNAPLLIDLGLALSPWRRFTASSGTKPPPCARPGNLAGFSRVMQQLVVQGTLLAYHDRAAGGLLVTLAEMAFAVHCGIDADIGTLREDTLAALFNEELGEVIQIDAAVRDAVTALFRQEGLEECLHYLGTVQPGDRFILRAGERPLYSESRTTLIIWWAETSWQMQRLRDNPDDIAAPFIARRARPKVGVLREQGVNSHVEMTAAFHRAGFEAVDVHMSDLLAGARTLDDFYTLVACGGFSYGDVLGEVDFVQFAGAR